MTVSAATLILGSSQGSPAQAHAYADARGALRPGDVETYIAELDRLCRAIGIRFEVAFGQWCDETGVGTSTFWRDDLNPAGIGALETLDRPGEITNVGRGYATGTEAARAHLVHLWLYAKGEPLPDILKDSRHLDPRADAVGQQGFLGIAKTLRDLGGQPDGRPRWAANPRYGEQIAAHINRAFPGLTDASDGTEQEEHMATPTIFDIRNDADATRFGLSTTRPTRNSGGVPARDFLLSRRFPNRNGNTPRFIGLHVQDGVTIGSLEHWTAGLDQWGNPIQASSTVMIQRDGSILRVIPEEHGPWTNGDINNPTEQSAALRALGGNPNFHCLTIEAEGRPWDTMPQAQLDAIVWQCRQWMGQYGIPHDRTHILPHSAINSVDRANCPGGYYKAVMAELGEAVEPVFATPFPPPPFDGQPKTINNVTFQPFKKQVTSTGVNRRFWAMATAPLTGPVIAAGTKIPVLYWIEGEAVNGNNVWLVGESGSRIWSGGVEEQVP